MKNIANKVATSVQQFVRYRQAEKRKTQLKRQSRLRSAIANGASLTWQRLEERNLLAGDTFTNIGMELQNNDFQNFETLVDQNAFAALTAALPVVGISFNDIIGSENLFGTTTQAVTDQLGMLDALSIDNLPDDQIQARTCGSFV